LLAAEVMLHSSFSSAELQVSTFCLGNRIEASFPIGVGKGLPREELFVVLALESCQGKDTHSYLVPGIMVLL
jgi:hypothetical protein